MVTDFKKFRKIDLFDFTWKFGNDKEKKRINKE